MFKNCKILCAALSLVIILTGCAVKDPSASNSNATQNTQLSDALTLGSQMPELTVTTAQGETLVLSELLQQKKMVVLNFWFADCIWCIREFPVMEVAYQSHKQDVEILALNPFDSDEAIAAFQEDHSLSFPMAHCTRDLAMAFGIGSYPTSVIIDRDGRICLMHTGAITESQVFDKLFETFTADDYTPRVYQSINDII